MNAPQIIDSLSEVNTDLRQLHKAKHRAENLLVFYRRKLTKLRKRPAPSPCSNPSDSFPHTDAPVFTSSKRLRLLQSKAELSAILQTSLDVCKEQCQSIRKENIALVAKIESRDQTIASDAKQLLELRMGQKEAYNLKVKLMELQEEHRKFQVETHSKTALKHVRADLGQTNIRVLTEENHRLLEELSRARCEADAHSTRQSTALQEVRQHNETQGKELSNARHHILKMEEHIRKLERQCTDAKALIDTNEASFEAEKSRMMEIVKIQKEITAESQTRLLDYEELVTTLKEELEAKVDAPPKSKMASHAEVLLKNLQDALDTRMHLLHQQKNEMERARASEMKMKTKQEGLLRDVEDAKWETERVKKEMNRMKNEYNNQTRKIAQLENSLQLANNSHPVEHPVTSMDGKGSVEGRRSSFRDSDIGPMSVIPTHMPKGDSMEEVTAADFQELSAIRLRHQRLLTSLRDRRTSFR